MQRAVANAEPCNLREWRVEFGRLYSCGRPGRGHYPSADKKWPALVPDSILHAWVDGLPAGVPLNIVSLLGKKFVGQHSEFKHYPFRSFFEIDSKPTFQEWLDASTERQVRVHEFPTVDADPGGIPSGDSARIVRCLQGLVARGETVVVVDSAGVSRTGHVCRELGCKEGEARRVRIIR